MRDNKLFDECLSFILESEGESLDAETLYAVSEKLYQFVSEQISRTETVLEPVLVDFSKPMVTIIDEHNPVSYSCEKFFGPTNDGNYFVIINFDDPVMTCYHENGTPYSVDGVPFVKDANYPNIRNV